MKKLFIILGLSFTLLLMSSCVKDEEIVREPGGKEENPPSSPDLNIDIDLGEEDNKEPEDIEPVEKPEIDDPIIYENKSHGFSLEIPNSWQDSYKIEEEAWFDDVSTSVSFNFKEGDIYSNVFTIIIFDEAISFDEWDDPFLIYIEEKGGKTYAYMQAMEPPVDVLEEENDYYLNIISKMVEEVPDIIETFNIKKF